MNQNTAISVKNLGKRYIIGHQKKADLRHALGDQFRGFFRGTKEDKEEFWALKDINFEVNKGEAVGIIGRNGAGKSTLLKILSRITEPTTGRIEINGRVSSLLEVGTGFHPELSGRENIFLNGTILGMRRAEIKAKLDEIVAFSGVEKFIDTPVKHYSSGMKVRLAFSVAAHLEPEILIVDEVLAVGDAEFQKKCLGKMDEVSKNEGRTVIFVSHNLAAVESLCRKGLILINGKFDFFGDVSHAVERYLNTIEDAAETYKFSGIIKKIDLFCNGVNTPDILIGSQFEVVIEFSSNRQIEKLIIGVAGFNLKGERLFGINNTVVGITLNEAPLNHGKVRFIIPNFNINEEGKCFLNIHLGDVNEDIEIIEGEVVINLIPVDFYKSGKIIPNKWGKVLFKDVYFSLNEK